MTMSQQLSWSDSFSKNLEFCPYQIPTSKIQFQDLKYHQFGDKSPHIWPHCSWRCLQFWRNYVKNITKTLKTSKISRIIYCHHCCHCHHHIVATILSWPSMLLLQQCCDNSMSNHDHLEYIWSNNINSFVLKWTLKKFSSTPKTYFLFHSTKNRSGSFWQIVWHGWSMIYPSKEGLESATKKRGLEKFNVEEVHL